MYPHPNAGFVEMSRPDDAKARGGDPIDALKPMGVLDEDTVSRFGCAPVTMTLLDGVGQRTCSTIAHMRKRVGKSITMTLIE